jgi:hypothetical protein
MHPPNESAGPAEIEQLALAKALFPASRRA